MKIGKLLSPLALVAAGAVLAGSGTALAATGGNFILGRANSAGTTTSVKNTGTGATLALPAHRKGQAPLGLSSTAGKVAYLNGDKLDGLDSSAFARASGKVGTIETQSEAITYEGTVFLEAYAMCPPGTKVTGGGHEVWTQAGAVISRADGNGWLVVTLPNDGTPQLDDAIATAQCYNPKGAVAGSIESFSASSESRLTVVEQERIARFAAKR